MDCNSGVVMDMQVGEIKEYVHKMSMLSIEGGILITYMSDHNMTGLSPARLFLKPLTECDALFLVCSVTPASRTVDRAMANLQLYVLEYGRISKLVFSQT